MGKILIIGDGGAGANTVKRMKEVGIPNASFITFGGYNSQKPGIPHYNLIEMNGCEHFNTAPAHVWEELAGNVKDEIGKIIDYELDKGE